MQPIDRGTNTHFSLAIFTCKDVYPEDELCISYKGQPEVDVRHASRCFAPAPWPSRNADNQVDIDMPTPGPAPTRTPKRTPKRGISTKSTASHTGGGKGLKSVCLWYVAVLLTFDIDM
jgi:hypothetical protein